MLATKLCHHHHIYILVVNYVLKQCVMCCDCYQEPVNTIYNTDYYFNYFNTKTKKQNTALLNKCR